MEGARQPVHVVAGVMADAAGRVLIAQRPAGKHLAGGWEFPGGKRGDMEAPPEALKRELREELGIELGDARPLIRYRHAYRDRVIDLDVWRVNSWRGMPAGLEGQALDWVPPARLLEHDLLPADRPICMALQLPDQYLITGMSDSEEDFRDRLTCALDGGIRLLQLRLLGAEAGELAARARWSAGICRDIGACLLINGEPAAASQLAAAVGAAGVHVPARYLSRLKRSDLPDGLRCGASCHDRRELDLAVAAGADFAVLGPVQASPSHPGAQGLGWPGFRRLIESLPLPVYALGGIGPDHLSMAWRAGGQGVAGISAFW